MGTTLTLCSFRFGSTFVPASAKIFLPAIWNPYPEIYRGCAYGGGTKVIFANWVVLTIEEGGTLRT